MNKTTKGISLAFTMFAIVGMLSFAPVAATGDDEGCTPGFWKANAKKGANAWPDNASFTIGPDDPVNDYISGGIILGAGDVSFIEALKFGGGPGVEGAERNLLRTAAAAMLNAAQDEADLDYAISFDGDPSLIALITEALESGDRSTILALHSELDGLNNADCPFNNSGKP